MVNTWRHAIRIGLDDGALLLLDDRGARVVAGGFHFTNEIRLDAGAEWLYVAETTAKRVTCLRVQADGSLTDREEIGPPLLGHGLAVGICFDHSLGSTLCRERRCSAVQTSV